MAAEYIAKNGLGKEGAPALVKFFTTIASRFGIQVTEKAAAQAIPVIGAATGASFKPSIYRSLPGYGKRSFYCKEIRKTILKRIYRGTIQLNIPQLIL